MLKTKIKTLASYKIAKLPAYLLLLILFMLGTVIVPPVKASISDQINDLQKQNAKYRSTIADLQGQATSYKDAIEKLHAAITALQSQIDANLAEQASLNQQIKDAQAELEKQKMILGDSIRSLYVQGQISTVEMLASSQSISDFIDKQVYQTSVQDKVKQALDKVVALKNELSDKKQRLVKLLEDQKAKQVELVTARDKQNELLNYNLSQQASYDRKTRANQNKIDELIASQRRANFSPDGGYYFLRFPGSARSFSPNNYPYRNAGFGMSPGPGCVDNDGPDPWGYCTRQCVSYAAWAVLASGRSVPRYWGNAKDWVAAAYARGIPVYRSPAPGDVAISTSGYWGHAMYVESVSGNTFRTSEYNTYLTGRLSYQTRTYY